MNDKSTPWSTFRMPAEWEPHAATWLAWPHYKLDWPGKFEPIPWVYAEIIRYLSRGERVEVIVKDAGAEEDARKILKRAHALNGNVRFHRWPTNRVWTRDSGCAFVVPCGPGALARETTGTQAAPSRGDWIGSTSPHGQSQRPPPVAKSATRVGQPSGSGSTGALARADLGAIKWQFNA